MEENKRTETVRILKELQTQSMAVDTELHVEDNVQNLIDILHYAEVQIERIAEAYAKTQVNAALLALREKVEKLEAKAWSMGNELYSGGVDARSFRIGYDLAKIQAFRAMKEGE